MDFNALFKRVGKAASENSPVLLTALAVTGTITTAYLAAKGAFQASETLRDERESQLEGRTEDEVETPTFKDKAEKTWQFYIPAVISGGLTITACICSNRISERRAAAMASAFAISERLQKEYQKATLAKVGKAKEQAIRDEVAQSHVDQNPPGRTKMVTTSIGDSLCFDAWSGRYFTSDIEKVREAVNDLNLKVINESYASLSDFWHLLDIPSTTNSDDIGWNTDEKLVMAHEMVTVNGDPCFYIRFETHPKSKYSNLYR